MERDYANAVAHWSDEEARRTKDYEVCALAYRQEVTRLREERARRQRVGDDCTRKLDQVSGEWQAVVGNFNKMQAMVTTESSAIKQNWQQVRDEFESIEREPLQQSQAGQLQALLRQIQIENHKIPQIGNKRLDDLTRHGILTGADIIETRLRNISSLNSEAISNLLAWRRSREREILLKLPKQPRPPEAAQHLRPIAARAQQLVMQLRDCGNKMQSHLDDLGQRLPQIEADWQKTHDANVRASAELAQCPELRSI